MRKFGIVKSKMEDITLEQLKEQFPSKKNTLTEETVALVNNALHDPNFDGEEFMSTLLEYQNVLAKGHASFKEYLNAVKFCAYLESTDYNITEAYKKARINDDFVKERMHAPTDSVGYRELTSRANKHHKSPMVRQILTQSDMPLYLLFQGARYQAVSVLAREMTDAEYSKDRIAAADKLLTHVKAPETMQIELGIGLNEEAQKSQDRVYKQMQDIALNQQRLLELGYSVEDIQKLNIKQDTTLLEAEAIDE